MEHKKLNNQPLENEASPELDDETLDAVTGGQRPKSEDTERREWREEHWVRHVCGYCYTVGYNADFNEEEPSRH